MTGSHPTTPTAGAEPGEVLPLICAVAMYGPPVLFLLVPWLLLGVMLSAPFVLAFFALAACAGATTLVAAAATLLRRAGA